MIKNKQIEVCISYRNITHYKKLGYNPILNKTIVIETSHLPTNSHIRIDVICELCGSENNLMYHKYIKNRERHNFYSCKKCSRQKAALTSIEKWGVDNYSKTDEYKKRVEETNIKKYGYKTNLISPDYIESIKNKLKNLYGSENFYEINRIDRKPKKKFILKEGIENIMTNLVNSEDLHDISYLNNDYFDYRNEVRRLSKRSIKNILKNWDGIDYYDFDYIGDNYKLDSNDPKYPTIDHKISIYYGYINNISPSEIADISNLCITKRCINSSKCSMIEEDFIRY